VSLEPVELFAERVSDVAEGKCPCSRCLLPMLEADRAAVALNAKRELLAEFKLRVETRKWLTLHVRKESGWGRAYAEVMRKMQAKYEGADQ
jgi:hypothetical protein